MFATGHHGFMTFEPVCGQQSSWTVTNTDIPLSMRGCTKGKCNVSQTRRNPEAKHTMDEPRSRGAQWKWAGNDETMQSLFIEERRRG